MEVRLDHEDATCRATRRVGQDNFVPFKINGLADGSGILIVGKLIADECGSLTAPEQCLHAMMPNHTANGICAGSVIRISPMIRCPPQLRGNHLTLPSIPQKHTDILLDGTLMPLGGTSAHGATPGPSTIG